MTPEEMEAASLKYVGATVVAISDGSFAVFGKFSNEVGLPLLGFAKDTTQLRLLIEQVQNYIPPEPVRVARIPIKRSATLDDVLGAFL